MRNFPIKLYLFLTVSLLVGLYSTVPASSKETPKIPILSKDKQIEALNERLLWFDDGTIQFFC